MSIRTKPFDEIDESDVRSLVDRAVQEDATIDFKQAMSFLQAPTESAQRHEFLKDVTAFANAYGGTLVYGIAEGTGTMKGVAKTVTPLKLPSSADDTSNQIDGILESGIDERIIGVQSKGIEIGQSSKHCWVIRVPPSHLAPHMIKRRCSKPKPVFYRRVNTTNAELDARGIKEIALKASTAKERALALIENRLEYLLEKGRRLFPDGTQPNPAVAQDGDAATHRTQVVLHVIPLFPKPVDMDHLARTLKSASLTLGSQRFAIEGLCYEMPGGGDNSTEHVLFLRKGGIEFQSYEIAYRSQLNRVPLFSASETVRIARERFILTRRLLEFELIDLPALVQLSLIDVEGLYLEPGGAMRITMRAIEQPNICTEPWVLDSWGARSKEEVRRMMDTVWQAFGVAKAPLEETRPWEEVIWPGD